MIEFQYPSLPDQWFYAPKMRLRLIGNTNAVLVAGMTFQIPGLDAAPPCRPALGVRANSVVEILNEIPGDFHFTITQASVRSTGGEATAVVTVTDGRGARTDIVAKGPIVAGKLPQKYRGDVLTSS